ncbi:hypothetical protein OYE22_15330 [Streptomyces sp. 71268]|uniref:hypothetical protein n=1 Tax=Streptomyces sp. 71268 TaxID=3002640 RepID=UPI0023F93F50|nr:hypothetical protein [Streptomyces sp. 71268]WEV26420.1 hypothetical protein OYE22_15330 [Streptomyces sp. 71268]
MDDADLTPAAREIQRRWRAREAPDGDFIVFADGSLHVMDLVRLVPHDQTDNPRAYEWHWYERLRATEWTANYWVDLGMMATHTHAGSRAWGGESIAHGSIGWVALGTDERAPGEPESPHAALSPPGTVEWLAICDDSNPFVAVTLDDTTLTATSSLGRVWTFPRDEPQQVTITEDPDYPWRQ